MTQKHADIIADDEFCLYRLHAIDGVLLYVGATHNFSRRMLGHKSRSWWPDVVESMTTVEWFSTPTMVSNAEEQAIKNENPVWNMSGRRTPRIPYTHFGKSFPTEDADDGQVYVPRPAGPPPRLAI